MLIAVQMDPIENIDPTSDSTFSMMLEALKRNYTIYIYNVKDLTFKDTIVSTVARKILNLNRKKSGFFSLAEEEKINLNDFRVVLMRQDPPFNMSYITATHILEKIHPKTLVVNNPQSVRNSPEKLMVTQFNDITPSTLITRSLSEINKFQNGHEKVIMKPLYGNGGKDIFLLNKSDPNCNVLIESMLENIKEPMIFQEYLPNVSKGDKRILLIDGNPVGAINRLPQKGEIRSNLHIGGIAEKYNLSDKDIEICEIVGPHLKKLGLLFSGIDVIGDKITEINVTSPTCIQEIDAYNKTNIAEKLWNAIEEKLI